MYKIFHIILNPKSKYRIIITRLKERKKETCCRQQQRGRSVTRHGSTDPFRCFQLSELTNSFQLDWNRYLYKKLKHSNYTCTIQFWDNFLFIYKIMYKFQFWFNRREGSKLISMEGKYIDYFRFSSI